MEKGELLRHIQEGIRTEESAVAIYYKHLRAVITRSGIAADTQDRIRSALEKLKTESAGHRKQLEAIMAELEKDPADDF
ncbi:MAG: hypothetical protein SWH68_12700 [Thermodesulfobacteriota bacterium]|nr:hypothetical protein [Thermodesulfobacteriota bacterium]